MPTVYSIHKGKCVRVADFGAFVELPGYTKWGLVHVTQLQDTGRGGAKVQVTDVVETGDDVWVKVLEVGRRGGCEHHDVGCKSALVMCWGSLCNCGD